MDALHPFTAPFHPVNQMVSGHTITIRATLLWQKEVLCSAALCILYNKLNMTFSKHRWFKSPCRAHPRR